MRDFTDIFQAFKKIADETKPLLEFSRDPDERETIRALLQRQIDTQVKILEFYSTHPAATHTTAAAPTASAAADFHFKEIFQEIKKASEILKTLHRQTHDTRIREVSTRLLQQLIEVQFDLLQIQKNNITQETTATTAAAAASTTNFLQPPQSQPAPHSPQTLHPPAPFFPLPPGSPVSPDSLDSPILPPATTPPPPPPHFPQTPPSSTLPLPPPSKLPRWVRSFGFDGFGVSLIVHAILGFIAMAVVVSSYVVNVTPSDNSIFATGAGGGSRGEKAQIFEHKVQIKKAQSLVKNVSRLTSKSSDSRMSLPEMPTLSMQALTGGAVAGNLSKGLGGGSGGGIGTGMGLGIGGGRNHAAKFVMGLKMEAQKIAVYLDNSGSMLPYLEQVKEEIYKQFPDADIFEIKNCFTIVLNNRVYGGRSYGIAQDEKISLRGSRGSRRGTAASAKEVKKANVKKGVAQVKKTKRGAAGSRERILERWGENFEKGGSLGSWMDIVLFEEEYDGLVVFSDFQDGIEQRTSKDTHVFIERGKVFEDTRTEAQKAWEREWLERFSDEKKGARLYLISIQVEPQSLWRRCVEASKGSIKMMPELRTHRRAAEAAARTGTGTGTGKGTGTEKTTAPRRPKR
jgi:hypothetical protein